MPFYRLTYSAKPAGVLRMKFENALAGQPEQFQTYIEATAKRAARQVLNSSSDRRAHRATPKDEEAELEAICLTGVVL